MTDVVHGHAEEVGDLVRVQEVLGVLSPIVFDSRPFAPPRAAGVRIDPRSNPAGSEVERGKRSTSRVCDIAVTVALQWVAPRAGLTSEASTRMIFPPSKMP